MGSEGSAGGGYLGYGGGWDLVAVGARIKNRGIVGVGVCVSVSMCGSGGMGSGSSRGMEGRGCRRYVVWSIGVSLFGAVAVAVLAVAINYGCGRGRGCKCGHGRGHGHCETHVVSSGAGL